MFKNKLRLKLLLFVTFNHAQEKTNPKGSPYFKVFWNYHNEFTKDLAQNSAFELKRVYLGYAYSFNKNISAKITYDIGSNSAGSAYTTYVKIAQLDWKLNPKIKLSLGLIGTKQFKEQKDLWGYRYVLKTFQNESIKVWRIISSQFKKHTTSIRHCSQVFRKSKSSRGGFCVW